MVSMIIVMIVFSLAGLVIINIGSSGMTKEKQQAYMQLCLMRNETIRQNRWIDESADVNELTIEKSILDYNDDLKILLIEVFKHKKKWFESRELVVIKENK